MEGNILAIFTIVGITSLYLVISAIVYRAIYQKMGSSADEEILAVFLGLLFPITIPAFICIVWVWSIFAAPFLANSKEEKKIEKKEKEEIKSNGQEKKNTKTKFKVGDLVTGVKGNPEEYERFYEGCVCRVLALDEDDDEIKLKLIGHIDKEANEEAFGQSDWFPQEHFTLIKDKKKTVKKVAKKSKK